MLDSGDSRLQTPWRAMNRFIFPWAQGPSTPPRLAPLPPRLRSRPAAASPQLRGRRVIDPAQQQRDAMCASQALRWLYSAVRSRAVDYQQCRGGPAA